MLSPCARFRVRGMWWGVGLLLAFVFATAGVFVFSAFQRVMWRPSSSGASLGSASATGSSTSGGSGAASCASTSTGTGCATSGSCFESGASSGSSSTAASCSSAASSSGFSTLTTGCASSSASSSWSTWDDHEIVERDKERIFVQFCRTLSAPFWRKCGFSGVAPGWKGFLEGPDTSKVRFFVWLSLKVSGIVWRA